MIIKTSELEGEALNYSVAKAIGEEFSVSGGMVLLHVENGDVSFGVRYTPSTSWAQGGPLIERFNIWLSPPADDPDEPYGWDAEIYDDEGFVIAGESIGCKTALIAAMRAIVAAELGKTVDVPEELLK